ILQDFKQAYPQDPLLIQNPLTIFSVFSFFLCLPAVLFIHRGVLDDLDFWGGNFFIVLGATIEIILLAWVFGIDRAWEEMHLGARMKLPVVFKFIIKYITPTFLLVILGYWFVTDWWGIITMADIPQENVPFVLGVRIVLLAFFILLCVLVWLAWRNRKMDRYY
ncbi:MAG: hypothetical protein MUC95_04205, partial [Spirochaetes bacterium]|nr:hypothetical protein [Spirochaetota bacterium]